MPGGSHLTLLGRNEEGGGSRGNHGFPRDKGTMGSRAIGEESRLLVKPLWLGALRGGLA